MIRMIEFNSLNLGESYIVTEIVYKKKIGNFNIGKFKNVFNAIVVNKSHNDRIITFEIDNGIEMEVQYDSIGKSKYGVCNIM